MRPLYLHPVTLEDVERMPRGEELRWLAFQAADRETIDVALVSPSKYQLAVTLWQLYEAACERYDRLVCSGWKVEGGRRIAVPQSGQEQGQVGVNSRYQLQLLRCRALKLRVPDELLERAKSDPARWEWRDVEYQSHARREGADPAAEHQDRDQRRGGHRPRGLGGRLRVLLPSPGNPSGTSPGEDSS